MAFVPFKGNRMRYAIEHNEVDDVRKLLARGVSPDLEDDFGRSMMWHAVSSSNPDIAQIFMEKNASLKTPDGGDTLLQLAARRGSRELVEMLFNADATQLNARNRYGDTALHYAALNGYDDVVDFLLEKGANAHIKNFDNRTALYLAQQNKHSDVAATLKAAMGLPDTKMAAVDAGGDDEWRKLSDDKIARVSIESSIGYKITEIFNFASRERATIYQNLDTKTETLETRTFDELGDKAPLEIALQQLQQRGGNAHAQSIHMNKLRKPG
ncbi:MAG: ankyrin repeat domain-containing protein [Micavibrio sp.]|nr:ankyrin repeat domain-containing protein [Micavibrio sp.]